MQDRPEWLTSSITGVYRHVLIRAEHHNRALIRALDMGFADREDVAVEQLDARAFLKYPFHKRE